jgi:hypothetical protein
MAATGDATRAATEAATWAAVDATRTTNHLLVEWFIDCANSVYNMWAYGGEWTGYDEWIEFFREHCGYEQDGRVNYKNWHPWRLATRHGGIRIMHKEFCIVSDRPLTIHIETVNGRGRLHNDSGPAKSYRDGWGIWAIHGTRVTKQIVEAPHTLTTDQILSETNAEIRRIMIDRFGAERLMRESSAELINTDALHGKLWRLSRWTNDEPIVMLEVVNSTPEPIGYDPGTQVGTWRANRWFKHYMLRVPPTMRSAREARAWTFDMPAEEFAPFIET